MSKIKPINKVINHKELINIETGEVKSNVKTLESTNLIEVSYEEYVIISSEAISYITSVLRDVEIGAFMSMVNMLKTSMNVVYKANNTPHTTASLQSSLNQTKSSFYRFLDKLHKAGVIWYLIGSDGKKKIKHIIVNPHVARKRKTFDREILALFNDIETLKTNSLSKV